jgi:hypothetical protein
MRRRGDKRRRQAAAFVIGRNRGRFEQLRKARAAADQRESERETTADIRSGQVHENDEDSEDEARLSRLRLPRNSRMVARRRSAIIGASLAD